jgi:hypothetical protein
VNNRYVYLIVITVVICHVPAAYCQPDSSAGNLVVDIVVRYPVIAKVFRGIEFTLESAIAGQLNSQYVAAWKNGRKFILPQEFNVLLQEIPNRSKISTKDRIEAFIRLAYWTLDPQLKIEKQTDVDFRSPKYTLIYTILVTVNLPETGSQHRRLDIRLKQDEIIKANEFVNGWRIGFITPKRTRYFQNMTLDSTVVVSNKLLKEMFPDVVFQREYSHSTDVIPNRFFEVFSAWFQGQHFQIPGDFNLLVGKNLQQRIPSDEELLRTYVILNSRIGDELVIDKIRKQDYEFDTEHYNYELEISSLDKVNHPDTVKAYFNVADHKVIFGRYEKESTYGAFSAPNPILSNEDLNYGKLVRTVPINRELFSRVFPGAVIEYEEFDTAYPYNRRLCACYLNYKFILPDDFNLLYKLTSVDDQRREEDRVEAYFRAFHLQYGREIKILKNEPTSLIKDDISYKRHVIYEIIGGIEGVDAGQECWINLDDEELFSVGSYYQGKWHDGKQFCLFNELDDNIYYFYKDY